MMVGIAGNGRGVWGVEGGNERGWIWECEKWGWWEVGMEEDVRMGHLLGEGGEGGGRWEWKIME